jgi:hypothetical protein
MYKVCILRFIKPVIQELLPAITTGTKRDTPRNVFKEWDFK